MTRGRAEVAEFKPRLPGAGLCFFSTQLLCLPAESSASAASAFRVEEALDIICSASHTKGKSFCSLDNSGLDSSRSHCCRALTGAEPAL